MGLQYSALRENMFKEYSLNLKFYVKMRCKYIVSVLIFSAHQTHVHISLFLSYITLSVNITAIFHNLQTRDFYAFQHDIVWLHNTISTIGQKWPQYLVDLLPPH
jgi:hypothetical protein